MTKLIRISGVVLALAALILTLNYLSTQAFVGNDSENQLFLKFDDLTLRDEFAQFITKNQKRYSNLDEF